MTLVTGLVTVITGFVTGVSGQDVSELLISLEKVVDSRLARDCDLKITSNQISKQTNK